MPVTFAVSHLQVLPASQRSANTLVMLCGKRQLTDLMLGNLGAHTFPFNSLQGTLKAISTSKQTGKDMFTLSLPPNWTLTQGALLKLLNCTRIALDWSPDCKPIW